MSKTFIQMQVKPMTGDQYYKTMFGGNLDFI